MTAAFGPSLADRVSTKFSNPLITDLWTALEAHSEAIEAIGDLHVAAGPEYHEVCVECGQPYPCRTRGYLTDLEKQQ